MSYLGYECSCGATLTIDEIETLTDSRTMELFTAFTNVHDQHTFGSHNMAETVEEFLSKPTE